MKWAQRFSIDRAQPFSLFAVRAIYLPAFHTQNKNSKFKTRGAGGGQDDGRQDKGQEVWQMQQLAKGNQCKERIKRRQRANISS